MEVLALVLLITFTLVGFACIFFTTFGTLVMLLGAILYALLTNLSIVGIETLLLLFGLYLVGEVSEYVFIIIGAKKFGASNAAVIGALVGGILGAIIGVFVVGIGIIFGTFLGIFLGAFLVELLIHRDLVKSLKAGTGGVLGRVGSIFVKMIIAIIMIAIVITKLIGV